MKIREITAEDQSSYLQLFTEGLKNDSESFRISPNDPGDFPIYNGKDSFTLGAFQKDQLIGVVSFHRDGADREKLRHKGWLTRMLVNREFRGQKIGSLLINHLIQKAKQLEGVEQINLTVISPKALKLYEQIGFIVFAEEQNAVKYQNKYYTEYQMVMTLRS